jgi:hypothetical protein
MLKNTEHEEKSGNFLFSSSLCVCVCVGGGKGRGRGGFGAEGKEFSV